MDDETDTHWVKQIRLVVSDAEKPTRIWPQPVIKDNVFHNNITKETQELHTKTGSKQRPKVSKDEWLELSFRG